MRDDTANAPTATLLIVGSILTFIALISGGSAVAFDTPTFPQPSNETAEIPIVGDLLTAGGIVLGTINAVFSFITALIKFMVNPLAGLGAPTYISVMFGIGTISSIAWSIARLIRGV